MKWNIVIDSSADLTVDNHEGDIGLSVVPLTIIVGDTHFVDDETLDTRDLLTAMSAEKKASSSACPSPDNFMEAFKQADNTICITMTSALSGTNNSARIAKEMLLEECPDKKVHIIDSKATAGKMVLLKKKACELIREGLEFERICEILDEYEKNTKFTFALGGYDNLIKTGRMSRIAGVLATNLGIRAVAIASSVGEIEVVKKPRGERKALETIVEIMAADKPMKDQPVVISHCKNAVAALDLKAIIKEKLDTDNIEIYECKGLTTFYTMEKGILVGY